MRSSRWWSERTNVRWPGPFATNPFEDRVASLLVVASGVLFAVTPWLLGRTGAGFDRHPNLGGYGWLIVALMLLAAAFSALWAIRRVRERGDKAVHLWLRVRRLPHDGQQTTARKDPDHLPKFVLAYGGSSGGVALNYVVRSGHYFDTSPIPWLIAGALLAVASVGSIWTHRRVIARPASTHDVEYIRDGYAKAAADTTLLLVGLSAWGAGLAGIPATAGSAPLAVGIAALTALVLAFLCLVLSVIRTKHVANSQAAAVVIAEPAWPPGGKTL